MSGCLHVYACRREHDGWRVVNAAQPVLPVAIAIQLISAPPSIASRAGAERLVQENDSVTSMLRCWVSVLATLINDLQHRPCRMVNSGIGANVISTSRYDAYGHLPHPLVSAIVICLHMNETRSHDISESTTRHVNGAAQAMELPAAPLPTSGWRNMCSNTSQIWCFSLTA